MGRMAAALALIVALAGCSSPVTHSSTSASCAAMTAAQPKYLCWLDVYGFNVNDDTRASLVIAGTTLCQGLRAGGTPDEGIAVLYRTVPDITEKQAGNLISAAQFGLCPETT